MHCVIQQLSITETSNCKTQPQLCLTVLISLWAYKPEERKRFSMAVYCTAYSRPTFLQRHAKRVWQGQ